MMAYETMEERYNYLRLGGVPFEDTFGPDRAFNQRFYTSREWRQLRHHVIARDLGCDLAVKNLEVYGSLYVHHMNPIRLEDLSSGDPSILDPEFLVTVSHKTHNAIHYGDPSQLPRPINQRSPGDTTLW